MLEKIEAKISEFSCLRFQCKKCESDLDFIDYSPEPFEGALFACSGCKRGVEAHFPHRKIML